MNHADRVKRCARALALKLEDADEARYLDIIAVVLQADYEANQLDDWDGFSGELATAAKEAAERLIARRVGQRKKAA
jgi:hypothetical protein